MIKYETKDLPNTPDSVSDRSIPLHLFRSNQVPSDQHSSVVPPFHHILMTSSPESVSSLALTHGAKDASRVTRSLSISGSSILSSLDVELVGRHG